MEEPAQRAGGTSSFAIYNSTKGSGKSLQLLPYSWKNNRGLWLQSHALMSYTLASSAVPSQAAHTCGAFPGQASARTTTDPHAITGVLTNVNKLHRAVLSKQAETDRLSITHSAARREAAIIMQA